jgi:YceI-like domain
MIHMKTNLRFSLANVAALTLLAAVGNAQEFTQFRARPGSKVEISGTSTIHDWKVESSIVGGRMELGTDFPLDPSQKPVPGKVQAKAEAVILVGSIKSGTKRMDEVMYETMNQKGFPKINYKLQAMSLKEAPKPGAPLVFDTTGTLTVAGITRTNHFPITMDLQDGGKKIVVKGSTDLKMTDFGLKPPAPAIGLGLIRTGDEIKVDFVWVTAKSE